MDTLKTTIYATLSTLEGVDVSQEQQSVFNTLPAVTFNVSNNVVNRDLSGAILSQDAEIKLDVWGKTSTETSEVLGRAEAALRAIGYQLAFTQDVPNPDDEIFHTTTRFRSPVV